MGFGSHHSTTPPPLFPSPAPARPPPALAHTYTCAYTRGRVAPRGRRGAPPVLPRYLWTEPRLARARTEIHPRYTWPINSSDPTIPQHLLSTVPTVHSSGTPGTGPTGPFTVPTQLFTVPTIHSSYCSQIRTFTPAYTDPTRQARCSPPTTSHAPTANCLTFVKNCSNRGGDENYHGAPA